MLKITFALGASVWLFMWVHASHRQIRINNPLWKLCLQNFLPFTFIETRITLSPSFTWGQTSRVCWWGDGEQRQSPLCYCGNRPDLWPLTSPARLSAVAVSAALRAAGSQTLTLDRMDGDGWSAVSPRGQLRQPHTESTCWPHVALFTWGLPKMVHPSRTESQSFALTK